MIVNRYEKHAFFINLNIGSHFCQSFLQVKHNFLGMSVCKSVTIPLWHHEKAYKVPLWNMSLISINTDAHVKSMQQWFPSWLFITCIVKLYISWPLMPLNYKTLNSWLDITFTVWLINRNISSWIFQSFLLL